MKETTYTNLVTLLSATLLIPLLVGGNAMVARACEEDLEEKQYANYEQNDTNWDTAISYDETVITDDFFKNNKGNEGTPSIVPEENNIEDKENEFVNNTANTNVSAIIPKGNTDNNEFTQNTPKKEGGAIDFQRNVCSLYGPDPNFHTSLQAV